MKILHTILSRVRFVGILIMFFLVGIPVSAFAASPKPTCLLTVTTPKGDLKIREKGEVLLSKGEEVRIAWESKNAKTAANKEGDDILKSGVETDSPEKTTTYAYHFSGSSKKVTCTVTVNVVEASFETSSLASLSSKPTITGKASGTKTVQVVIRKEGSAKNFYKSKTIKVKNEKWKVKVTKKLPDGAYDVLVYGEKSLGQSPLVTGKLTIGKDAKTSSVKADTTLMVSSVPLLFGGTVRAGGSVPVSYLQITNTGKQPASLKGFSIKQNGSAPAQSIIGLTTVDDKGGSRGLSGGIEGAVLFKDGVAFAPVTNVVFAPGQMKLFTIKTMVTGNTLPYVGTQLMIDVASIDTDAKVSGQFPIRGTTWTIQ